MSTDGFIGKLWKRRILRFGFVGACGTVVNLGILSLMVKLVHAEVLFSAAVAIEGSILFNFFLNHHFTFKVHASNSVLSQKESLSTLLPKMGKYNIGALGGAAISFTSFTFLYKLMHLNYLLADLIAIGVATSWNYYVSTHFVWKSIDEEIMLKENKNL